MGLLDVFRKKSLQYNRLEHFTRSVIESFQNVKEDIDNQKKWISYLHSKHMHLNNSHFSHKKVTEKDIENIKAWVTHLNELSKKQQEDLKELKSSFTRVLEEYNKQILDMHKRFEKTESSLNKLSEPASTRVPNSHFSSVDPSVQATLQVLPTKESVAKPHFSYIQPLTNPEQRLLNLLLTLSDPVKYEILSSKTGQSINTVRVNMNNLKKRDLIEENTLPSGIKLFSAKNKEKIKKMYSVQVA